MRRRSMLRRSRTGSSSSGPAATTAIDRTQALSTPTKPDAASSKADAYTVDPRNAALLASSRTPASWLVAQDDVAERLGAAVVYESAPFDDEPTITGAMRLSVWLSMDVRDTDLRAVVYEVTPDGQSIFLGEDLLRARYRRSPSKETPVALGLPDCYEFGNFPWFARRLTKGSHLRVVLVR